MTHAKRKLAPYPSVKGFVMTAGGEEGTPTPTPGIISRMDYDSRADNFASLVTLIQGLPSYAPNEPDLHLTALQSFATGLRNASGSVAKTANALANARIHRNAVLRGKDGMFETANAVKDYIRSVFGVSSEPAKELGKLRLAALNPLCHDDYFNVNLRLYRTTGGFIFLTNPLANEFNFLIKLIFLFRCVSTF